MKTFVLSAPGRESISRRTVEDLERQNPGEAFSVYVSPGLGGIADFWSLLRIAAARGDDALLLEDDILTARNFIRFAASWRDPHLTSFFHSGAGVERGRPQDPRTFGFNQALRFPQQLLEKVAAAPPPPGACLQDDALSAVLAELGEEVVYHRSLVQHTGAVSICQPGRSLWGRLAPDFVGRDFDCLELPSWG